MRQVLTEIFKGMLIRDLRTISPSKCLQYIINKLNSSIKNSYRSDHSPINLQLIISKHKKGKGNWKLNNSLLEENELKIKIEKEIELIISTYACTPYNLNYIKNDYKDMELEFMMNIELLWEVLHAQLRNIKLTYAANKKRKRNKKEIKLTNEITEMEKGLPDQLNNGTYIQKF